MSRPIVLLALVALGVAAAPGKDKAPAWLLDLAKLQTPSQESDVPGVVLLQEEYVEVSAEGVVSTRERYAVKILSRKGAGLARASAVYNTRSSKVRSLDAWVIYSSGQVKEFGKKEMADASLSDDDVYNEARVQLILGSAFTDPGSVWGFESVVEDRSIFTQFLYRFQDALPTLSSRFTLKLPPGWHARTETFNSAAIEAQEAGGASTWQMQNLGRIADERGRPSIDALVPHIAVSYFPSGEDSSEGLGPSFKEWAEVSAWLAALTEPQTQADPAIDAKVRELTANEPEGINRIAALGRFAQGVKYVSIQTGVGRGGGYQPHAATEVLAKSYGDCKDKANLMRTMLRSIGVESYPVAIYSGSRRVVREQWASPQQFNHAIIAIAVPEDVDLPAVTEVDGFGRLLFFDPTSQSTAFGWLPESQQDSWALLVDPDRGQLVRAPSVEPEANLLERTIQATLAADGSIEATIREVASGASAADNRSLYSGVTEPQYRRIIERWVTNGATSAQVSKIDVNAAEPGFELDVALTAPGYAQSMGGRLLVFKPAVVARRDGMHWDDEERVYPITLHADALEETTRLKLPAGFKIDEKPADLQLDKEFGTYEASWTAEGDELVFKRRLLLRNAEVPPEQYAELRGFFNAVTAAEVTPVVLVKQ